jgi:hypothetical protein
MRIDGYHKYLWHGEFPFTPSSTAQAAASQAGDRLGILTEAILTGDGDIGAIGQENAMSMSNSASRPGPGK